MNKNEFVIKPSTSARQSLQAQSNAHISGIFSSNMSFAHYEYDTVTILPRLAGATVSHTTIDLSTQTSHVWTKLVPSVSDP